MHVLHRGWEEVSLTSYGEDRWKLSFPYHYSKGWACQRGTLPCWLPGPLTWYPELTTNISNKVKNPFISINPWPIPSLSLFPQINLNHDFQAMFLYFNSAQASTLSRAPDHPHPTLFTRERIILCFPGSMEHLLPPAWRSWAARGQGLGSWRDSWIQF